MKKTFVSVIILFLFFGSKSQSVTKGDIIFNANIGSPHLFKAVTKLALNTPAFENNFDGKLLISQVKGINPIAIRGEYAINKYFGLGINYSFWTIKFNVTDYYNAQNQSVGNAYKDSVDIYKFKISSKSLGIRPNFHFQLKSRKHDIYVGVGLGFTSNKLSLSFSSTDAGRFAKKFRQDLSYNLSLPGGIYFAPSIGYRGYLNKYLGLNFELGYEKGAIFQAGIVIKISSGKKSVDR